MDWHFTRDVEVPGYGKMIGDFVHNEHGYFCKEINGLRWPKLNTIVPARATLEEAALALLELYAEKQR